MTEFPVRHFLADDAVAHVGEGLLARTLPREEWTDEAREVFAFWGEPGAWENGSKTNMTMTLAHHPKLANAYHTFGKHLLLGSTVAVRPRRCIHSPSRQSCRGSSMIDAVAGGSSERTAYGSALSITPRSRVVIRYL